MITPNLSYFNTFVILKHTRTSELNGSQGKIGALDRVTTYPTMLNVLIARRLCSSNSSASLPQRVQQTYQNVAQDALDGLFRSLERRSV